MHRRGAAVGLVLMGSVALSSARREASAQQTAETTQAADRLSHSDRFLGTLTLKNKAGKTVPVQVSVSNWGISAGVQAVRFPSEGFVIVQLHSGRITTTIEGKRQERREGEFWTVPAGAQMTIEVGGEAAVLQVVTLKTP